ncbi:SIR2 family protein [Sulfurospirillum arcachonense]|uniref:SIR2 family protein n=1 Tax=Sulfurospirillum arcachonense TaxID=57666 RepID=UPI0004698801|nr:SIR2 family protein [Sulfurospirillum arcachonense]
MDSIKQKLIEGSLVPFLGMGVFKGVTCKEGKELPYDSDSFVLALNNGRAMSPRLMYEYTRAAMSLEQRKGREYITQMTNHIYSSKEYDLPPVYEFLKELKPKYLIDTNMDDSSCKVYEDVPHFMVTGVSRVMGGYDRFIVYMYNLDSKSYDIVSKEELNGELPILFKPMGSTIPEKNFIVSDADFVDWLTEAMGGYAMPAFLKEFRKDKSYLFLGVDFSRDTYRMVSNEITLELSGGFIVSEKEEFSKKEDKFIASHNLEVIQQNPNDFLRSI